MIAPMVEWIDKPDCSQLMWGHIKVGDVSKGTNGTWYAFYLRADYGLWGLKDFPDREAAQREVERAISQAVR